MAQLPAGRTTLPLFSSELWRRIRKKRDICWLPGFSGDAACGGRQFECGLCLLYVRDNALVAQRFDPRTYTLGGEPRTISDEVQ
jgi:hypothetical protein